MKYRLFQYPLPAPEDLPELNAFLGNHRVAATSHQVVAQGTGAMLVFVVEYVDGSPPAAGSKAGGVDYRQKLNEADFAIFDRLRAERRKIADAEGVQVYNVFNNAQLAEMVEGRATTEAELREIAGVGEARLEKYGAKIVAVLKELVVKENKTAGGEGGEEGGK